MSTRSGRVRQSMIDTSPSRNRKGVSPTRSPARARKSSPPARASRKSPSRKSPSRKPAANSKFPARKSPSRSVKESVDAEVYEPAAPKSPAKRPAIKSNLQSKQEDVSTNFETYRSTRSNRTEYSVKDLSSSLTSSEFTLSEKINGGSDVSGFNEFYGLRSRRSVEDAPVRRASKLRELIESVPDIRRSFSKSLSKSVSNSVSKSVSKSLDTFSDDENSEEEIRTEKEKSRSVTRKLATPLPSSIETLSRVGKLEFGGNIGSAILSFLVPLTVLAILIPCTKSCSYEFLDLSAYINQSVWFSVEPIILLLSHCAIQAAILLIPVFGLKCDRVDETGRKYCFNAFFSALFTVNVLFGVDYFELLNTDAILSSYLRLASASYILGLILSIILFVKSSRLDTDKLNSYGNGYTLYDFFVGREIHPYIKNLNVKLWVTRISNITALILTILIFKHGLVLPETSINKLTWESFKDFSSKVQLKATVLVFSMMQLTYILNFIMKEYQITSTFYWQSEGMGYLQIVSSALYPFYFTTVSKFTMDANLSLSTNTLIAATVLYFLGFVIMLISNNIKYEFRQNPLQSSLANLDSMPTFHGKRLLVSHLWGVLRHPNYTGDILVHIALALPGIVSGQLIAAAPALLTILILLHRVKRDHARCKRRYGAAWQRYCKRVPSAIIPKVL